MTTIKLKTTNEEILSGQVLYKMIILFMLQMKKFKYKDDNLPRYYVSSISLAYRDPVFTMRPYCL